MTKKHMLVSIFLILGSNQLVAQNNHAFVQWYNTTPANLSNEKLIETGILFIKGKLVTDDYAAVWADADDYEAVYGEEDYQKIITAPLSKFEIVEATGEEINYAISKSTGSPVVSPLNGGKVKRGDLICVLNTDEGAIPVFKLGKDYCFNAIKLPEEQPIADTDPVIVPKKVVTTTAGGTTVNVYNNSTNTASNTTPMLGASNMDYGERVVYQQRGVSTGGAIAIGAGSALLGYVIGRLSNNQQPQYVYQNQNYGSYRIRRNRYQGNGGGSHISNVGTNYGDLNPDQPGNTGGGIIHYNTSQPLPGIPINGGGRNSNYRYSPTPRILGATQRAMRLN